MGETLVVGVSHWVSISLPNSYEFSDFSENENDSESESEFSELYFYKNLQSYSVYKIFYYVNIRMGSWSKKGLFGPQSRRSLVHTKVTC